MLKTLFTDRTYLGVMIATVAVTVALALAVSHHLALYVLGIGVLVLMAVADRRKETWTRNLIPVFLVVFAAVLFVNQI